MLEKRETRRARDVTSEGADLKFLFFTTAVTNSKLTGRDKSIISLDPSH